ncbi:hypothetical protein TrispH2_011104 [Trichoplax sp. H2]|uniref:Uncharacterized protein n=1 Tax=Trichoplax adhaerens TaxID=10228 RepID=B3RU22_TRIAD|nr:predicted protein [Trichoplax adhaerens]EDV25727.1 predicted protein [Trichoplax adhaerens]RDD37016.1 hypothetical protein TrispH2_011104 [Trichoplax sp. H2]|eukprot:XP_002111760.1 predicted protein [Trichoplax adhaerens]
MESDSKLTSEESEISLPSSIIDDGCCVAPFYTQNDSLNDDATCWKNEENDNINNDHSPTYITCPTGLNDQDSINRNLTTHHTDDDGDNLHDRLTNLMQKLDTTQSSVAVKTVDKLLTTAINRYSDDQYRCRAFQIARCILQQYGMEPFQSLQTDSLKYPGLTQDVLDYLNEVQLSTMDEIATS